MFNIIASIAKVGVYNIKAINSLVHGGPYLAIYQGGRRVAWLSLILRSVRCTMA